MSEHDLTIRDRLEDILESIGLIEEWSQGMTELHDFMISPGRVMAFNACVMRLQVIGEHVGKLTFKDVDMDKCVLLVPQGCVSVYKNAAYWGEFKNIKELKRGDANGDGLVNVADIVVVVNIIREGAYNKLADMNNDGVVDNKDLSSIKDIIMKAG
jgi:hypothetical protein